MTPITINQLIQLLQVAIGPVVLTSGIGLLIVSMTNRLGRGMDRGRQLAHQLPEISENERAHVAEQLRIFARRADLLRVAITFAALSILLAVVLVIILFLTALWELEDAWLIGTLFVGMMLSLVVSLVAFVWDLNQSVSVFRLETDEWLKKD
jgi:uncharacterized membrane protein YqjE